MLNHALPPALRERLLSEAVRRHEVSARALPAIEDLLRHGVSFEQALVGTGLISSQVFVEWMKAASGLTCLTPRLDERTLPPGLELETVLAWQVIPQKIATKRWMIGLTNPWDMEVRSAIEALAVEHGWTVDFAYVLPSVADQWLRAVDTEKRRSAAALARYARSLVDRVEREKSLTLVPTGHVIHPTQKSATVPAAWIPALQLRLARQAEQTGQRVHHHRHHRHSTLQLEQARPARSALPQTEHPVRDWTEAFQAYFSQGKLVFIVDEQGDLLTEWPDVHVAHEVGTWREGRRWVAAANPEQQEELFHLTLAGYPGTVCLRSTSELRAWEQAADKAQVEYAACIGHLTDQGIAWSLYSV